VSNPEPPVPPAPSPASAGADEALFAALVKADRSESFGPIASDLAHQLSELLTKILGAVSLAKDSGDKSGLADAEQAGIEARELVRRLLALAKGGNGGIASIPARLLLDEAGRACAGSPVEIDVKVAEGTDPVQVDRGQMLQAFENLVRNAIEAMPPPPHRGRIQLSAANASLADGGIAGLSGGDYVEFEVRDNGSGIAPENLEKIWEPFFTTRKHGAGLGLPAALAIVRRHRGQIGVDSDPGGGSVFTVFLPRTRSGEEVMAHRAASRRFATGRVLVMDDDDRIRALAGAMLQGLGYTCDLARDGDEATVVYRRYLEIGRPHDAVILDLSVARGLGGEAAFGAMLDIDPEVRAIIATDDEEAARRCLEKGFCGWLAKPFRPADLGRVLKTVIG
jgi:CheY-like chemotaxis protein